MHQLIQNFSECAQVDALNEDTTVSIEQYLYYLAITDTNSHDADLARLKFSWHDYNGDGTVSFYEAQLLCDANGCL
jgi:hypothetical protein